MTINQSRTKVGPTNGILSLSVETEIQAVSLDMRGTQVSVERVAWKSNLRTKAGVFHTSQPLLLTSPTLHFFHTPQLMASFCKPQRLVAMVLLLFIFTTSSLSSARILNSDGLPATDTTTTTTMDLALFALDVEDSRSEQVPEPCGHHMTRPHVGILRSPTQRLTGNYGPMILGKLPKGVPVPPSAPSKGINNINN
ncbi:hypothetical protein GQ457_08G010120 [Hibiscus cannabinus]